MGEAERMDKQYDTVIFDMDGTLLDTLEDLTDSVNAALTAFGRPVRTIEEVRRFVGNGVLRLMELSVPEGREAGDFDAILEYFKKYYSEHSQIKTRPYEGITELVRELKDRGYKMAIVSNKFHDAVCALSQLYFGDLLPVAIGENEAAGIRKKPSPDTVFSALDTLGAVKAHAIYVGDSEVDYATSVNAGMDCILVSWGFRERELLESFHPKYIADVPADILSYVEKCRLLFADR
jgi:phosphoglycolate phosphatase